MVSLATMVCVTSLIGMVSAASLCPEDEVTFMFYEVVLPVTAMSAGFGLMRLFKSKIERALFHKRASALQQ
jgi:hypothetical protein